MSRGASAPGAGGRGGLKLTSVPRQWCIPHSQVETNSARQSCWMDGTGTQGLWPAHFLPVGLSSVAAEGDSERGLVGKGVELSEAVTLLQCWGHKPGVLTLSTVEKITRPSQGASCLFFFPLKYPGLMDLLCRHVSFPVQWQFSLVCLGATLSKVTALLCSIHSVWVSSSASQNLILLPSSGWRGGK